MQQNEIRPEPRHCTMNEHRTPRHPTGTALWPAGQSSAHIRPSPVIRPKDEAATTSERAMARSAALPARRPPRPAWAPHEP